MAEPYATSDDHLWEELGRIDKLVRARAIAYDEAVSALRRSAEGQSSISLGDVHRYITRADAPSDGLRAGVEDLATETAHLRRSIDERLAATEEPLRLQRLVRLFELAPLEVDVLLAVLLPAIDDSYRHLFALLQDDVSLTGPGAGFLIDLLRPVAPTRRQAEVRAALAADGTLRAAGLVLVAGDQRAAAPFSARPVRIDDRIADYLLGSDRPDARLADVLVDAAAGSALDELVAAPDHVARLQRLADWVAERAAAGPIDATLFLHGSWGSGRRTTARALSSAVGLPLLEVDAAAALATGRDWTSVVTLAFREARLRGGALLWTSCEVLLERDAPPQQWQTLVHAAEQFPGLALLSSETAWDPAGLFRERAFLRFDVRAPDFAVRTRLWDALLPESGELAEPDTDRPRLAENLSNGFQFTAGQIADSIATARGLALHRDPSAPAVRATDLVEACRRQSARRLVSFTRRIEPSPDVRVEHLVLPPENLRQLQELRDRIANRARVQSGLGFSRHAAPAPGLIALFTGSSGTGKTMAAELLAREHGVDLYKVDLAAIVSKYVGDTEKNLAQVFSEAEDANAIIFFDEADAVFGRRGEVRDARDRWANMEVNYLLQRVEDYAGVVILASNLRQNIDEAFTRRIAVIVEFPFPDASALRRIFLGLIPRGVGRPDDDDLALLADRFRLSGGSARNIVVDAAFRAVAENAAEPAITMRHLVLATAREYQKLGKPVTRREFGEPFYPLLEEDALAGAP